MPTKEQFLAYKAIREEGLFNMIMDANVVMDLLDLTKEQYLEIIKNYSSYYKQFITQENNYNK